MAQYDCLIIDDEAALSQSTCEYFNLFGVKTAWAADEAACFSFLEAHQPSLILLDINLGDTSGFALCKQLRETLSVPILFISARTSDDDILVAFGIGGDDYIKKPYSLSVLLAKVKAMLKRYGHPAQTAAAFGDIRLDFSSGKVTKGGAELSLKAMEYKLLSYLVGNPGRVISKDELFREVWQDTITGDGTLNVHIRRLREKIEPDPNDPVFIKTVWGRGYEFILK